MNGLDIIAQAAEAAPVAAQQPNGGLGSMLIPLFGIAVLFYFMIIRPQKREQAKVTQMRNSIKNGDRVRSIGGIFGTVSSIDEDNGTITVQVDKNVKIEFDKNAIATVITKE